MSSSKMGVSVGAVMNLLFCSVQHNSNPPSAPSLPAFSTKWLSVMDSNAP